MPPTTNTTNPAPSSSRPRNTSAAPAPRGTPRRWSMRTSGEVTAATTPATTTGTKIVLVSAATHVAPMSTAPTPASSHDANPRSLSHCGAEKTPVSSTDSSSTMSGSSPGSEPGARVRWMRLVSRGDIRFVQRRRGDHYARCGGSRTGRLAHHRDGPQHRATTLTLLASPEAGDGDLVELAEKAHRRHVVRHLERDREAARPKRSAQDQHAAHEYRPPPAATGRRRTRPNRGAALLPPRAPGRRGGTIVRHRGRDSRHRLRMRGFTRSG